MKTVEVTVEKKRETEAAYLVTDGDIEAWLPKSQVKVIGLVAPGGTYMIEIPEWLAKEKELI